MKNLDSALFGEEEEDNKAELIVHPERVLTPVSKDNEELFQLIEKNTREDYSFSHESLKHIIKETEAVIIDASSETRANYSARSIESLSLLLKTFSEMHNTLASLNNLPGKEKNSPEKIHNEQTNIYVGTEDLIDAIKNRKAPIIQK